MPFFILKAGESVNRRQDKFLQEYIESGKQTQAYQKVYECSNERSASANASRLLKKDNIKREYEKRIAELRQISTLKLTDRQLLLTCIALDADAKNSDRIKAVDTLNRIDDIYNDTAKQDTTINITLPDSIKELSE